MAVASTSQTAPDDQHDGRRTQVVSYDDTFEQTAWMLRVFANSSCRTPQFTQNVLIVENRYERREWQEMQNVYG
jgi:hypothetical protein